MSPQLATIDASEPLDTILDTIARDGGVVVANLLSKRLLEDCMRTSMSKASVTFACLTVSRQSSHILLAVSYTMTTQATKSSVKASSLRDLYASTSVFNGSCEEESRV